jgi:DNA-binding IscR family transcriptional regulator
VSYALSALILIRLDARRGEVVSVVDLVDHLQVTPGVIQAELELLEYAQQLQTVRGADGQPTGAIVATEEAA